MKHIRLYFILLSMSFLMACEKDTVVHPYAAEALNKCVQKSVSGNPLKPAAEYTEFNLNGKRILLNDGHEGYAQYNIIAQTFITSGPILDPGNDSSRQYLLKIGFRQPFPPPPAGQLYGMPNPGDDEIFLSFQSKANLSTIEFIDQNIHEGMLKLRKKPWWDSSLDPSLEEGFEINYWCANCCEGKDRTIYTYTFNSIAPDQKGYLRCAQLNRQDLGDSVFYHIEFEFDCELYQPGVKEGDPFPSYYVEMANIRNGKMVVDFVVEK